MKQGTGRYLIRNARIVTPTEIVEGDICLEEGVISYIGLPVEHTDHYEVVDAAGKYAVPGFVEIHAHGGAGFDLTWGSYDMQRRTFDPSLGNYQDCLARLMGVLAQHGTTQALLSTIAAPLDRLEGVLGELDCYVRSERNGRDGAMLSGAFIEGTFIKNPDFAGAQNPRYFCEPKREIFDRLQAAAGGQIRYVNIVPEHGEVALDLIRHVTAQGVLVGAGHTSSTAEQYRRAVDAGLRIAVHFTNGPTGSSFKPFGGGSVLQSVLTCHKVYAELIGDGYHVNPSYLMDILYRKTPDRIVAVTDAFFAAGATDSIREFEVSGIKGRVSANGEYLQVVGKENTLFGSVLNMRVAFSNWVSWLTRDMPGIWFDEYAALELDEAVVTTARLCSSNPARALGIYEPVSRRVNEPIDSYCGSLQVGKRADVVLLSLEGEPGKFKAAVHSVFVKGRRVVGAAGSPNAGAAPLEEQLSPRRA